MIRAMKTEELNEKQREAVEHIDGPLLVLAGAGSGKTKIVTCRIARLIEMGADPSSILAVTFTNKAAQEMRERIEQMCAHRILATTFHSLCVRILRERSDLLGYSRDFGIYDTDDTEKLVRECLKEKNLPTEKKTIKTLLSEISQRKNHLQLPEDLPSDDEPLLIEIYSLYQKKLKEYGAIDFDDMLLLTVKLFETHPEVLSFYQEKWKYLSVDEYQDTNEAQYRLCKLLAMRHQNLFVVGDPDQSIYSWRGAKIDNILHFEDDYPETKVIALEQNYRSTNTILSAANALIQNNPARYEKKLWSALGDGEKIQLAVLNNEREEAEFVVHEIAKTHQRGTALEECVVFYRTNFQSRPFEDQLIRYQIPYVIIGGLSFYQRKEIKDILAYLRIAINPADFLSFSRTINLPKRGIGLATVEKLGELANSLGVGIFTASKLAASGEVESKLSKKQKESLRAYLSVVERIRDSVHQPISESIETVIDLIDYNGYLDEDPETAEDKKENVQELIAKAEEWEGSASFPQLKTFLEELALHSQSQTSVGQESVRLMTLHNGKGLEFETAFLVGMEEELFPHVNSYQSEETLEEERRLAYVGMTRAKKNLFLTCARYRFLWGGQRVMRPSRFLREIPKEFLLQDEEEEFEPDEEEICEGRGVMHREFGRGVITKQYTTSLGLTYDVYFPQENATRTLVASFAKLTML